MELENEYLVISANDYEKVKELLNKEGISYKQEFPLNSFVNEEVAFMIDKSIGTNEEDKENFCNLSEADKEYVLGRLTDEAAYELEWSIDRYFFKETFDMVMNELANR